jgi:hypothetical protein
MAANIKVSGVMITWIDFEGDTPAERADVLVQLANAIADRAELASRTGTINFGSGLVVDLSEEEPATMEMLEGKIAGVAYGGFFPVAISYLQGLMTDTFRPYVDDDGEPYSGVGSVTDGGINAEGRNTKLLENWTYLINRIRATIDDMEYVLTQSMIPTLEKASRNGKNVAFGTSGAMPDLDPPNPQESEFAVATIFYLYFDDSSGSYGVRQFWAVYSYARSWPSDATLETARISLTAAMSLTNGEDSWGLAHPGAQAPNFDGLHEFAWRMASFSEVPETLDADAEEPDGFVVDILSGALDSDTLADIGDGIVFEAFDKVDEDIPFGAVSEDEYHIGFRGVPTGGPVAAPGDFEGFGEPHPWTSPPHFMMFTVSAGIRGIISREHAEYTGS